METTHRKAVNSIKQRIKNASSQSVHIFTFNIFPEELDAAHTFLDKCEGRKAMRVTYSDDHNFIVRYIPGQVHNEAYIYWTMAMTTALQTLTEPPYPPVPPGCRGVGATAYKLGPRMKQADAGLRCLTSMSPSILLEVGSSESFAQLQTDAKLWFRDMPDIQLVIILLIDPPVAPHPNHPRIIIELWRGFPVAPQRDGQKVWQADWTEVATPMYISLSDIFRGQVPAAYGVNTQVNLDTAAWRQAIIDSWK